MTKASMTLRSFLFFSFPENDSGGVCRCFLHDCEFTVFTLVDWLVTKAREPSLPCDLTYSRMKVETDS